MIVSNFAVRTWWDVPHLFYFPLVCGAAMLAGMACSRATLADDAVATRRTTDEHRHPVDAQDAVEVLNPIYFRVALACLKEDRELLDRCAEELATKVQEDEMFFVPASFGRLVIFDEMNDKERFIIQFAELCGRRFDNVAWGESAEKRMTTVLQRLSSERKEWHSDALMAGLPRIGPEPDGVSAMVLQRGMPLVPLAERQHVLEHFLSRSQKRRRDPSVTDAQQACWNRHWHTVVKVASDEYHSHLQANKLWPLTAEYISEFGAGAIHSRELFSRSMHATCFQRQNLYDNSNAPNLPEAEWLKRVHDEIAAIPFPSARLQLEFDSNWDAFAKHHPLQLPLGRIAVADLARDPRLKAAFTGQFSQPTLRVLLERISGETGVALRVGPTTDPELVVAASINFSGPLLGAMRMLVEFPGVQAEWERTADGYVLHSTVKRPTVAGGGGNSGTMRMVLVACNVVVVLGLVRWLWVRQRKPSAGTVPAADDRSDGP